MTLRVIGGELGGRGLHSVRGRMTRPLRSAVREALFNILAGWVEGRVVWDLFAGTGSTGIEALSRGADRAVFVEKSNQALAVLRQNLETLKIPPARALVLKGDAWEPTVPAGPAPDLIFLDPPYATVAEDPVRAACRAARLASRLAPDGLLCFHFEEGLLDADDFDGHLDVDLRRWGRSAIALIEVRPEAALEAVPE